MRFLVLVLASVVGLSAAPPRPLADRLTEKERAQGYSDRVILAKPRPDQRTRADQEEGLERVRIREKFSRLGDLRVIEVEPGETVDAAITRLQATGRCECVERDQARQAHASA